MDRRGFLAGIGAVALAGCGPRRTGLRLAPDTTLIVVRHGEKDGDALTKAGEARAAALAARLAETPLDAIYSTSYARNVATAQPLADLQGLDVTTLPDSDVAGRLQPLAAGRTVLWVGNQGNIAPIWEAYGFAEPAPMAYGDLAIVRTDAAGRVRVEMERFGA